MGFRTASWVPRFRAYSVECAGTIPSTSAVPASCRNELGAFAASAHRFRGLGFRGLGFRV